MFVNPPYGHDLERCVQKAYLSAYEGATVVCLVPVRTDTKWWHRYAVRAEIRWLVSRRPRETGAGSECSE